MTTENAVKEIPRTSDLYTISRKSKNQVFKLGTTWPKIVGKIRRAYIMFK